MTTARPVQEFYSIGEVCALTDLKPHVLRYWESQFRFLNPAKNRSGNRVYKSREVELIMLVKHLLYTEKYTIEGARQRIDQYRRTGELKRQRAAGVRGARRRGRTRAELDEVLAILDGTSPRRRRPGRRTATGQGNGLRRRFTPSPLAIRAMNILVTNDDGILAPGLALLADVVPGGRPTSPWSRPTGSRAAPPTRSRCTGRSGPRGGRTARGRSTARPPTA